MTSLRISVILTIIIVAFLCIGLVAGLNQDQATARVSFSSETLPAGHPVTGAIYFSSTSSDPLAITAVSIHFDWMPSGQVVGYQLTTPFTIEGGGNHLFDPMQIQIPLNIASGSHNYYIGIDGTENGIPFSWDSSLASVDVTSGTGSVSPAPTSTNSGGDLEGQNNLLMFGAIGGIVVVVVLLVLVLLVRKKRTSHKPAANQSTAQPENPGSPQKPNPEQDFNI